jgi:hypothetical protein
MNEIADELDPPFASAEGNDQSGTLPAPSR